MALARNYRQMAAPRILASDWYALMLGGRCESIDSALRARFGGGMAAAAGRIPALRGLLIHRAAHPFDLVAIVRSEPGSATFLALEAIRRGPRRVVLFELIGRGERRGVAGRTLLRACRVLFDRPVIGRTMLFGQVLTEWERSDYSQGLELPIERLRLIRWPLVRTGGPVPPRPADGGRRVVSSGRAYCDWETLFMAARGREWDLLAICGRRDLKRVVKLAAEVGAEVRCELPREEHDRLLAEADVYALCLEEGTVSAGQVRLASAVGAAVPVVASRVRALAGYADGGTALLVPPADADALGGAVDSLLARPAEGLRLRDAALRRASSWTYGEYFAAIGELLDEALAAQRTSTR